MATRPSNIDGVTEHCRNCSSDTTHTVSVELRTESNKAQNAEFSREPYRISTCTICSRETVQRMNDA